MSWFTRFMDWLDRLWGPHEEENPQKEGITWTCGSCGKSAHNLTPGAVDFLERTHYGDCDGIKRADGLVDGSGEGGKEPRRTPQRQERLPASEAQGLCRRCGRPSNATLFHVATSERVNLSWREPWCERCIERRYDAECDRFATARSGGGDGSDAVHGDGGSHGLQGI